MTGVERRGKWCVLVLLENIYTTAKASQPAPRSAPSEEFDHVKFSAAWPRLHKAEALASTDVSRAVRVGLLVAGNLVAASPRIVLSGVAMPAVLAAFIQAVHAINCLHLRACARVRRTRHAMRAACRTRGRRYLHESLNIDLHVPTRPYHTPADRQDSPD